jgi:hypothetical protein
MNDTEKKPVKKAPAKKAAVKKAPAKKAPAKKAATKKKAVDYIQETAHEVENLTFAKADKMVATLQDEAGATDFKLGGIFSRVIDESWYLDAGYDTARDMFEQHYGVKYRKALYLVAIYRALVDSEVKWNTVKTIGWTKLRVICQIMNKENAAHWIKIAKKKGMTVIELTALVKAAMNPDGEVDGEVDGEDGGSGTSSSDSSTTTKTFKFHADQLEVVDQALEQGKEAANTEHDSVAIEHICMSYLEGDTATVSKPADLLKKLVKSQGWKAVLEAFGEAYPEIDLEVTVPEDADYTDDAEDDEDATEGADDDDSWAEEEDA